MSNEIDFFTEDKFKMAITISEKLSKSSIVPMHFRNKPEEIFSCLVLGAELGFKPMQALNAIVIIQGQATLKAQTQLALVRAKCPNAIIIIESNDKDLRATCTCRRSINDTGFTSEWTMEKAKKMGLSHKDNWIKQPATMLRWRAISECLRIVFPEILQGVYATEEIEDLDNQIKIEITDYKEQGQFIEKIKYLLDAIKTNSIPEKADLLKKIDIKLMSDLDKRSIDELKKNLTTLENIFNAQKNTIPTTTIENVNSHERKVISEILEKCKVICASMDSTKKQIFLKNTLKVEKFEELESWDEQDLIDLDAQLMGLIKVE